MAGAWFGALPLPSRPSHFPLPSTNARRDVSSIDLVVANLSTVITATKPGSPAKAAARELLLEQEDSTERVYVKEAAATAAAATA